MKKAFLAILTLSFSCVYGAEVSKSTAAIEGYVYKARNIRDPLVPLASGALGRGALPVEKSGRTKTLQEIEQEFDPSLLVIKALLGKSRESRESAILANSVNPNESYLVQKGQIKHLASGVILRAYVAQIQGEIVLLKRVQGEPLIATIGFPEKEEETSP